MALWVAVLSAAEAEMRHLEAPPFEPLPEPAADKHITEEPRLLFHELLAFLLRREVLTHADRHRVLIDTRFAGPPGRLHSADNVAYMCHDVLEVLESGIGREVPDPDIEIRIPPAPHRTLNSIDLNGAQLTQEGAMLLE